MFFFIWVGSLILIHRGIFWHRRKLHRHKRWKTSFIKSIPMASAVEAAEAIFLPQNSVFICIFNCFIVFKSSTQIGFLWISHGFSSCQRTISHTKNHSIRLLNALNYRNMLQIDMEKEDSFVWLVCMANIFFFNLHNNKRWRKPWKEENGLLVVCCSLRICLTHRWHKRPSTSDWKLST